MTIDRNVNEIPLYAVTITVIQYRFPRDVLKELEGKGCIISQRSEGIYEISGGPIIFPFQIIDAVILGEEWDVLNVLVPGATEKQIQEAADKKEEKFIENMLRDNVKADVIIKWTGVSIERIYEIASKMGMSTIPI